MERIRKAAAKLEPQLDSSDGHDPIRIEVIGAWPWPAAEKQAMERMIQEFATEGLVHA